MVINVYKEKGCTSRDVVNTLSKHFKTKKVGHTGTLDPIASGVLIICTDKDTKLVEILTSKTKEYIATIKLGIKTDTGDTTGNIIETKDYHFTKKELLDVLNSFLGKSIQEVPIYSAVKINGKKLYEYARNNEKINLPKREIEIYSIELIDFKEDIIKFKVKVSKGTYIRSLINDICKKLNTVGTMENLERTKQGDFKIEDSNKISDILNNQYKIVTDDFLFKEYPHIPLNESEFFKVNNGCKMTFNINDEIILLTYQDKPIALYQKDKNLYRMYKKIL